MLDGPARSDPKLVTKLKERKVSHRERHPVYRATFVLAGVTCLVAGAAMLVLPGPAFVVIPIGLALLALEFTWAETLLDRSLREAAKAQHKAAQTTALQRVLAGVATVLAAAAFVAVAVMYDVPLLPV